MASSTAVPESSGNDFPPTGALDRVEDVVCGLLATDRDRAGDTAGLYDELEALAHYIARAKGEIAAVGFSDIPSRHMPEASIELGAIGAHLEEATGTILDCCEALEETAAGLGGEPAARIGQVVTRIFEACSFQDITGQRITKIVATLQAIDARIVKLIEAFGQDFGPAPAQATPAVRSDADLLAGPQLPGAAISQADIDAILADFG